MALQTPRVIDEQLVFSLLRPRPADSHKGTFGTLLCLCGSLPYRGAALLATEGALRSGAGIVQLASVEPVLAACCVRLPEATLLPLSPGPDGGPGRENLGRLTDSLSHCRGMLAGCGLTPSADTAFLVSRLTAQARGTVVLDADALNALAGEPLPHPAQGGLILTPHPGEMARLTGRSIGEIQQNRVETAVRFAAEQNCVLVLKGNGTIIAAPDGRLFINHTGNPGLAKGGSGDILAGLIAGLACSGLEAAEAAVCGVFLHGLAADRCAARLGQAGMLPHDILADLGAIFAEKGR